MEKNNSFCVPEKWFRSDGSVIACAEKIKVLEENWKEIRTALQDMLDDAVLMGCSESCVKQEFSRLVNQLSSQYKDQADGKKNGS